MIYLRDFSSFSEHVFLSFLFRFSFFYPLAKDALIFRPICAAVTQQALRFMGRKGARARGDLGVSSPPTGINAPRKKKEKITKGKKTRKKTYKQLQRQVIKRNLSHHNAQGFKTLSIKQLAFG